MRQEGAWRGGPHARLRLMEQQRAFYDERWSDFNYANRLKLTRCAAVLAELARLNLKEPRICDVGCGAGWLTSVLSTFGPTHGVDWSDGAVSAAREQYRRATFEAADLMNWRPQQSYSVAVCQEVIEHFEDPDQVRLVDTLADALAPDGWLILTTPNRATFAAMPTQQREGWTNQPIENWLSIGSLKSLVSRRFRVDRVRTVIPGYGTAGMHALAGISHRRLPKLDSAWLRLGFGLHTVITSQKK